MINATLDGTGTLVDQGTVVAEGSSAIDAPLTTAASSTLNVLGTNTGTTLTVANGFTNNSVIELTSTGAPLGYLTITIGTLTNAAGASIECLAARRQRMLNASLDNQGTISVASGSTFTLSGPLAEFSGGTLSGGTYDIAGTFQFAGAAITSERGHDRPGRPRSADRGRKQQQRPGEFRHQCRGGSFTVQDGQSFATAPAVAFSNAGTLTIAAGSTFDVTGTLTNFSGTTLTDGTFVIGGTLQFTGANIVTNAATIVLDSPSAQIVDEANNNALANFAANCGRRQHHPPKRRQPNGRRLQQRRLPGDRLRQHVHRHRRLHPVQYGVAGPVWNAEPDGGRVHRRHGSERRKLALRSRRDLRRIRHLHRDRNAGCARRRHAQPDGNLHEFLGDHPHRRDLRD